eukprot:8212810-Pyramimonas_sp.AAC.1
MQECNLSQGSRCRRCQHVLESDLRRAWGCPQNADFRKVSDFVVRRARADAEHNPSFWFRGLTPSSWTAVPPPPEVADFRRLGDDLDVAVANGFVFGGGGASGGQDTQDPMLRGVAWSWVVLRGLDEDG